MKYSVEAFCDNPQNAITYLVYNEKSCIIIDPANSLIKIKEYIKDLKVEAILLTHGHYDHFKDLPLYLKEFNTKVYMHKNAYNKLTDNLGSCANFFTTEKLEIIPLEKVAFVNDNTVLTFNDFTIKCIFTPGHTNCSITYLFDNDLFVGDLLFSNSVGRWDLPTGNIITLMESLKKIKVLNPKLIVHSGHDDTFELNYALKHNYYLNK